MKRTTIKKSILLSIPLTFMLNTAAMAIVSNNEPPVTQHSCDVKNPKKHFNRENKGNHYTRSATLILINKYGVRMDEITKAKESGKTVFDIAQSKGLDKQKLKDLILAPRLKTIDEMVSTGELTKEDGELVKNRMKQHIEKWDGKLENYVGKKGNLKVEH